MDKGRFLIETHLRTGRPIAELAAAHGVHRSWLYKLLARYRREGDAGLSPAPGGRVRQPTADRDRHEDAIVALRKELADAGFDAGADTIHNHLRSAGDDDGAVGRHDLAGAQSPRASSPPSPTSAPELLAALPSRAAQ